MRDPKTEQYLTAGGFRFEFHKALSITSIDMEEAQTNPARMTHRLDEERALNYGVDMERGVDFPAIVVFGILPPGKKHHLCTGLHRVEGKKSCGQTSIDAYVVSEPDDARREYLIRSINSIEGVGTPILERLAHIIDLLKRHPKVYTVKDLAAGFSVKESRVISYQKEVRAEERANGLGIGDCFGAFAPTLKLKMDKIQNDNNFARLVHAATCYRMSSGDLDALANEVAHARTEEAGRKLIEETELSYLQRDQRAKNRFGNIPRATPTRFVSGMKSLLKLGDVAKLGLNAIVVGKPMDQAIDLAEQLMELLGKALKSMKARQAEYEAQRAMIAKANAAANRPREDRPYA